MWLIFRDPQTVFNHLDKFVYEVVEDEDILKYHADLHKAVGGSKREIRTDVHFLQHILTCSRDTEYFARKYTYWRAPNRSAMEDPVSRND